jgi:flagellar hook-length control protein FliK
MRALFSLVGLLVVVAIVMLLARKQLQAVAPMAAPPTSGAAPTVQEQSRSVQQKVLQDVNRALEQGAARGLEQGAARPGDSQP